MTTSEIAAAVEAWIVGLVPELEDSSYAYHASRKSKPFPDVAIEVDEASQGDTPQDVGMDDIHNAQNGWEQVVFRSWSVRVLFMTDEDPPAEAEAALRGFSDSVMDGLLASRTMGGRVSWVSRSAKASYTPPFVEYDDGARGRLVTLELLVGGAFSVDD